MEDIIYILIGIAWIGFSIYSQQRKLKKKQQEARERRGADEQQAEDHIEREEPSLFDKLFEEYASEPESEPEPETYRQPQPVQEKPLPKFYDSVERAASRAGLMESNSRLSTDYYNLSEDITKDPKKKKKEDQSHIYDYEYEDPETLDFDLRTAVIYSVILERPYD